MDIYEDLSNFFSWTAPQSGHADVTAASTDGGAASGQPSQQNRRNRRPNYRNHYRGPWTAPQIGDADATAASTDGGAASGQPSQQNGRNRRPNYRNHYRGPWTALQSGDADATAASTDGGAASGQPSQQNGRNRRPNYRNHYRDTVEYFMLSRDQRLTLSSLDGMDTLFRRIEALLEGLELPVMPSCRVGDHSPEISISDRLLSRSMREVQQSVRELLEKDCLLLRGMSDDEVARCFCPITQSIMSAPVTTSDGLTYDRGAVELWLQRHDTSPLTNLPLPNKELRENSHIRGLVEKLVIALE